MFLGTKLLLYLTDHQLSYLASYLQLKPFLAVGLITPETSTFNLRFINGVGSVLVALLVRSILLLNAEIHNGECEKFHDSNTRCEHGSLKLSVRELVHSMINICLFPPLFFFYGLYYTDVLSVVTVLYAYRCYLSKQETKVIFAGLLSLLFRQTNIFWVSVFLGGMELCRCIPKGRPDIEFPSQPRVRDIIDGSWRHASAYDPPVNQACVEGLDGILIVQRC